MSCAARATISAIPPLEAFEAGDGAGGGRRAEEGGGGGALGVLGIEGGGAGGAGEVRGIEGAAAAGIGGGRFEDGFREVGGTIGGFFAIGGAGFGFGGVTSGEEDADKGDGRRLFLRLAIPPAGGTGGAAEFGLEGMDGGARGTDTEEGLLSESE